MNKKHLAILLLFLMTLIQTIAFIPLAQASPITIEIDPAYGSVGTTVTVEGIADTDNGQVEIYWDLPANIIKTITAIGTSYSTTIEIPESVAGTHAIGTKDTLAGETTAKPFIVDSSISLTPDEGNIGVTITVSGSGFANTSNIVVTWNDTSPQTVLTTTSNVNGSFVGAFVVPPSTTGTHTVNATDANGNTALAQFTVWDITISRTPTYGYVGTDVYIEGKCNTPLGDIEIQWDSLKIDEVTAHSDGTYSYTLTVPPSVNGEHQITVVDVSSTNNASATFTVLALLSIDPQCGFVGDLVKVSGSGFSGAADLKLSFDEKLLFQTVTDNTGSFNNEFIVPFVARAGNYTTLAEDEHGITANATFTVTFVIYTRSLEYFQGDYPSFFIQAIYCNGDPISGCYIYMTVYDSMGYLQYEGWTMTIADGTVPYNRQFVIRVCCHQCQLVPFHLPSDAPIGTWSWEAFTCQEMTVRGSFEVVEAVDLRTLLEKLDQLLEGQDDIASLIAYYGDKLQLEHTELALLIFSVSKELSMEHDEICYLIAMVAKELQYEHQALAALIASLSEQMSLEHQGLALMITNVYTSLSEEVALGNEYLADLIVAAVTKLQYENEAIAELIADIADQMTLEHQAVGQLIVDVYTNLSDEISSESQYLANAIAILSTKLQLEHEALTKLITNVAQLMTLEHQELADLVTEVFNALNIKLDDIKAEIVSIEEKVDGLYLVINDLELKLDDINAVLEKIRTPDLAEIRTDIGTIKTRLAQINTDIEVTNGKLVAIKTDLGTIEGEITSIEGDIANIETPLGTIQTTIDTIKGITLTTQDYAVIIIGFVVIAILVTMVIAVVTRKKQA